MCGNMGWTKPRSEAMLLTDAIYYAVLDSMTVDYLLLQQPDLPLKQVPVKPNGEYPNLSGRGRAVTRMNMENPDLFDAYNAGVAWLWRSKKNAEFLAQNGMTNPD